MFIGKTVEVQFLNWKFEWFMHWLADTVAILVKQISHPYHSKFRIRTFWFSCSGEKAAVSISFYFILRSGCEFSQKRSGCEYLGEMQNESGKGARCNGMN